MHNLNYLLKEPYSFLVVAAFFGSAALVYTCMGKVWGRFNGWIYQAEKPRAFWIEVALYCLIGVWFLGCYLYKAYGLWN